MTKNEKYALLGVLGGVLYEIADWFLFLNSGLQKSNPDPAWAEMDASRFLFSMLFAVAGSCCLCFGYIATCRMLEQAGGKLDKAFGAAAVMGVAAVACAHFLLGCVMPLIYKGMVLAGCEAQYLTVSEFVNRYTVPVSVLAMLGIYLPHLASVSCLLRGKLEIAKWRLAELFGILLAATLLAEIICRLLGVTGSYASCESLLEGLLCLIPYRYWKHRKSTAANPA